MTNLDCHDSCGKESTPAFCVGYINKLVEMKRGKKGSGQNKNDSHESNASVTPSIKVAARAGKSKSSFNAQVISASQGVCT